MGGRFSLALLFRIVGDGGIYLLVFIRRFSFFCRSVDSGRFFLVRCCFFFCVGGGCFFFSKGVGRFSRYRFRF